VFSDYKALKAALAIELIEEFVQDCPIASVTGN